MAKIALGRVEELTDSYCLQNLVAEFICTFLFVCAGVGFAMTENQLVGDSLFGFFVVTVAHALVVSVMISAGLHTSSGHFNPAVTLGLCVAGRITIFRSLLYWIDQLLASALACLLLKYLTGDLETPPLTLAAGVGQIQGLAGTNTYWVCSGSQYLSWWTVFRGFHEPCKIVWAVFG